MLDKRARLKRLEPVKRHVKNDYFSLREEFSGALKNFKRRPAVSCRFSKGMNCCRVCNMGPCQVVEGFEELKGICGASAATVVGRNFSRMVVSGASAHSEHARDLLKTFRKKLENGFSSYNAEVLKELLKVLQIEGEPSDKEALLKMVDAIFKIFIQSEGRVTTAELAPEELKKRWEEYRAFPRGINREVVELFHKTTVGVDQEYRNILRGAIRTALADGWGASFIAAYLRDFMFGFKEPITIRVNLGLNRIDPESINISVYETDPYLTDALLKAIEDDEIKGLVKKLKAKGINFTNVFNGVSLMGSFIQQEVSLGTGLVEAVVIGSTCVSPNLVNMAKDFHTLIITTDKRCNIDGASFIEFDRNNAVDCAKEVLKLAITRFKKRDKKRVRIPEREFEVKIGFRNYNVDLSILKEGIEKSYISGVVLLLGCDTPCLEEPVQVKVARELVKNDILVLVAGCTATSLAMTGLMSEEGIDFAGEGLKKILKELSAPPVWYLGACIDVPHVFGFLKEGVSIVACIPEWMSESMVSIAMYLTCSGIPVVLGSELPTLGSKKVSEFITESMKELFSGYWKGSEGWEEIVKNVISISKNKKF